MCLHQLSLPSPIVDFGVEHWVNRTVAVSCNATFLLESDKDAVPLADVPIHAPGGERVLARAAACVYYVSRAGMTGGAKTICYKEPGATQRIN